MRSPSLERYPFVATAIGSGVLLGLVGAFLSTSVAELLQKTPATTNGWLLLGWAVSGPPFVIAALTWAERAERAGRQRRDLRVVLGIWAGLSMFVAPGAIYGVSQWYGTAALIGDPLTAGWLWGIIGNAVAMSFAAVVLGVLFSSVPGGPSPTQRALTLRFLERSWLVILLISFGLALYGPSSDLFRSTV